LVREGEALLTHPITWELVAPIAAHPRQVVVVGDRRRHRVTLRTTPAQPFRVLKVTADLPGCAARVQDEAAAPLQSIELDLPAGEPPRSRKATLNIETDLAEQPTLRIPIVRLD
jgi:hypothetical protein